VDGLKGWLACFFGKWFCIWYVCRFTLFTTVGLDEQTLESLIPIIQCEIVAGIFAVLGHNFTCWLKFKGGKGIATSAGVYLALAPWAVLIAAVVFLLALVATRYVSVGSISAAIALPAAVWILPPHNLLLGIVTTVLGVLAIYKHKGNIQRLIAGTENRLQFKKKEMT
jgi:acyl phosphate:glycerol-3-phosphate acyltransferase